jgi:CNT family concentrative nucleoside transporter
MGRFTGLLGILVILALAFVFSTNRRAIRIKTVAWGLGLQFLLAVFVLRVSAGERLFAQAGYWAKHLLDFSYYGSPFRFFLPSFSLLHSSPCSITSALCS